MPSCTVRSRLRRALLPGLVLVGVVATTTVATQAMAAVGSDDFEAGQVYRGDFPDPSVLRIGTTYHAFATNTGGKLLPAMTSTDLRTWRARHSNTGRWWQNDALLKAPRWARQHYANGKWRVSTWAPSVTKVGDRYVAAYVAPVQLNPRRMCVTLAYSDRPLGMYVDSSSRPFVCARDQGSIDPYIYKDAAGTPYLLWKNEGIPRREPTRIWVRQLNATATAFAPGSVGHHVLTTEQPWEGNVIENPAMIRANGRVYLFYSANRYSTADYATGYAICTTPMGPCRRPVSRPLLATGGRVSGPGGPDAFRDAEGRLRLAYAAWDYGRVGYPSSTACRTTRQGCNQRRLHVAKLAGLPDGRLRVTDRG